MPLTVIRNDITKMSVDVIVNVANTNLQAGGGVCGAIFSAAGADRLQRACDNRYRPGAFWVSALGPRGICGGHAPYSRSMDIWLR